MSGSSTAPKKLDFGPYAVGSYYNADPAISQIIEGSPLYNLENGKVAVKSVYRPLMGAQTSEMYQEYHIKTPPQASLMTYDEIKATRAFNPATFTSNLIFSTPDADIVSPRVEKLNKILGN